MATFTSAEPCFPFDSEDQIPGSPSCGRSFPPRDLDILNYVTLDTWKSLRVPKPTVRQDLSMFPNMHLDVVLEVFSHLHPLDLLHVSRSYRGFRELLHSPTGESIWRNAFICNSGLPKLPEAVPTARWWAAFIYGPNICDACGIPNTLPDYILWRRLCKTCRDNILSTELPDYAKHDNIYDLIPKASCYGTWRGRFWLLEGEAIAKIYESRKSDRTALHQFVERRRTAVKNIRSSAKEWQNCMAEMPRDYITKVLLRRRVEKRLLREGWEQLDADDVYWTVVATRRLYRLSVPLRTRLWKRVRPYFISLVAASRDRRLADERRTLIHSRREVIKAAALNTLSVPVPYSPNFFYPPPHTIHVFPSLVALVEELSDKPLEPDDMRLGVALAEAHALVENWCAEQQSQLTKLVPASDSDTSPLLARATSVFLCPTMTFSGEPVMATAAGWDSARGYLHWFNRRPKGDFRCVQFSPLGSASARMLADMLGMQNPDEVPAAAMDSVDARFVCAQCPAAGPWRPTLTWRKCIEHDVENNNRDPTSHLAPSWLVLSPLALQDLRRRGFEGDSSIPRWPYAAPRSQSREEVYDDIYTTRDLVFWPKTTPRPRKRYAAFREGTDRAIYRCNRCAADSPAVVKLFSRRAIKSHVADKHLIDAPCEDNWTEVQLYLTRLEF